MELELTSPTRQDILAQQQALELEQSQLQAPPPPTSRLTGEQVDLFNPQGALW